MSTPHHPPFIFDEFFASGKEESISPFLTPNSRNWGRNLPLRAALMSAVLLALAFSVSFFHQTASYLFLIPVYFLSGTPAFIDAIEDLRNLEINIDVLMTLAAFLSVTIGSGMEGALLLVLFELSAGMENSVTQKTKGTLLQLNQLSPRIACVIDEKGIIYERSVKEIPIGSLLLIKAGEIVPLDGIVIQGSSFLNLVHLTGESQPIPKKKGDEVPAGARNLDGSLTIEVTRTSSDSTLSRIIQLITNAQEAKPKLERFLDRFGKWYASTIIILAFVFALGLPFIFAISYLGSEGSIYRALTFLIAASPCALIIATPTAYLSAINSCARKGIILKGGTILDALNRCTIIAFDKTGTLTTGQLICTSIEPVPEIPLECDLKTAIGIASSLERHAVHPIATAICNFANEQGISSVKIEDFKSIAGSGLQGSISLNGKSLPVFIGHSEFIDTLIPPSSQESWKKNKHTLTKEGHIHTILLVGSSLFTFQFKDAIRPQITEILERLKTKKHIRLVMLTGDHTENAQIIAKELLIDEVDANLRPEDKLRKVAELSDEAGLMMVGDGINDAPALARATVGISMGKIGSAAAIDASDVVFLNDDLSLLEWLIGKAHQTVAIVKQNLILALAVILLATTPALLGIVPLWLAVILHEGGTVLVGLNSLRLLK